MDTEDKIVMRGIFKWATLLLIASLFIVVCCMWGCPQYKVYSARKDGESLLAHATSSKEFTVCEAKAKMESATLLSRADTIRAHGIARSNEIIGRSLTQEYLHWFWIDGLEKNPNAVIYVPTEANMPIMEANRIKK